MNTIEEAIFHAASELEDAQARAAFLKRACGADSVLRARIEALLEAASRARQFLADDPLGLGPEADHRSSQANAPPEETPGMVIGRYKLLQKIGEGGMGVVYMAEQQEPVRRRVALKIIKLGMDTRQVVARFEAERQALALMDHPNIAKVFDGGATDGGRPYFVMELVQGVPITEFCDLNQLTTEARVKLFIPVCQAIQSAHQKGIIHRDLKPTNILVTLNAGVPIPKVIDFGVAKAINQRLTEKTLFTNYATLIGTPAYMSPEQAEMSSLDVDTRADIYSLGTLLYELLTGTPPFPEKQLRSVGYQEMQRIIKQEEPERPSTRQRRRLALQTSDALAKSEIKKQTSKIGDDLDWIVMKCLEKDRARRYETANALVSDLQRHLNNEPVLARPPSRLYEFQKLVRRHKLGFAAAAAVIATLAAGVWASSVEAVRARRAELHARQRAYASDMNVAHQALADNNLGQVLDLLNAQRPKPGQKDLRGWEWRYLWRQARSDALFTLCQQPSQVYSLAASPDGDWLAIGMFRRGGLSLWNLRTRVSVLLAEEEWAIRAAFSPTQPLVAFTGGVLSAPGGQQFRLRLWNAAKGELVGQFPLDDVCMGLAFSEDGRTLVTSTAGGRLSLWRIPEPTVVASYASEQARQPMGTGFAATRDLSLAAYALTGGIRIRVVDLRDGKEIWTTNASKQFITALAFSSDNKTLASAAGLNESDIRLWSAATGQELGRLQGHSAPVFSLAFWPDGKRLASGSTDDTIRLWDISALTCVDDLRGHLGPVWQIALLSDGKTLVSGSKDGTVCLWDTSVKHLRQPRLTMPESILAWRFAPDSRSVLTLDQQGRVTRWTGPGFELQEPLLDIITDLRGGPWSHLFSPDGRFLAALSATNNIIRVWDVSRRVLRRELTSTNELPVVPVKFLADGERLITSSASDDLFHEWDLGTGSETQSWRVPRAGGSGIGITADERWGVVVNDEGNAVLRNLQEQSSLKLHLDVVAAGDATFSADGRLLAIPSGMGYARVWRAANWRYVATLGGFPRYVQSVAFSSDSTRLATGSDGKQAVRLWDTESWQNVLAFEGQGAQFFSTAFSPNGNALGSLSLNGVLHIWQAPSWAEIEREESAQPAPR